MLDFLDVVAPTTTKSFEQTTGVNPIVFCIVIAVIVIAFVAIMVVEKRRK